MPIKLHRDCQECSYKNDCDKKLMEACAYFSNPQIMADAAAPIAQPIMADIAVKHDYRDIKCGDMTFTIDIEKYKRRLEERFNPVRALEYGG